MFVGMIECDVMLGDVHSLKGKRAVIRPLIARLRRLGVNVAEVGDADLHRRALIGAAVVCREPATATQVLDECERIVAGNLGTELLATRRRIVSSDDEGPLA